MAMRGMKASMNRTKLEEVIPLDTPYSMLLDISSVCNFHCKFCPHTDETVRKNLHQGFMETKLAKKCIDDLTRFNHRLKALHFYDFGESLLHRDLAEIVRYAAERDVSETYKMTTNASLLTRQCADSLIAAGLTDFNISLYGLSSEDYQQFCGVDMDFETFVKQIEYLYSIRGNARIIVKITDAVLSSPEKEQMFYDIFDPICDVIAVEHASTIWYDFDCDVIDGNESLYKTGVQKKEVCPYPFWAMTVHSDGLVSPCCHDYMRHMPVGNAYQESLPDIWNGEKFKQFRLNMLREGVSSIQHCDTCGWPVLGSLDNIDSFRTELLHRLEEQT